jgi:hypothetical protein
MVVAYLNPLVDIYIREVKVWKTTWAPYSITPMFPETRIENSNDHHSRLAVSMFGSPIAMYSLMPFQLTVPASGDTR